ncbi:RidA family protein [Leifsonia bigeumensis]|uniref:RidA family protein n=1 Tax=Leifsonella bigeumensis TaxID=433643 RepID=A0ABP7F4F1_9MICO
MSRPQIEFIAAPHDLPFSTAVRVGDMLYLSGQIGVRSDGVLAEGFQAQARQTMDNIAASLTLAGSSMADVVKATIMIADMARWGEFNTIYLEYFDAGRLPARSAFGANALALGAEVEVECWAYAPA